MSDGDSIRSSSNFRPLSFSGNLSWDNAGGKGLPDAMATAMASASRGKQTFWGIPFRVGSRALVVKEGSRPISRKLDALKSEWLLFSHSSMDSDGGGDDSDCEIRPKRGIGSLGEHAADYVVCYADGSEVRAAVRRRHQVGRYQTGWGERCVEAVEHVEPHSVAACQDQAGSTSWGWTQTRVQGCDGKSWLYWLWAWRNPHPRKAIVAIRFEPVCGVVVVAAITAGRASSNPFQWRSRRKAVLKLPVGQAFDPTLDDDGQLAQVGIDMGNVISAIPRTIYPNADWSETCNNALPQVSQRELVVEYTSHADASFYLAGRPPLSVARVEGAKAKGAGSRRALAPVNAATRSVKVRIVEKGSGRPLAVRLHVHGEAGEYLPPMNMHRRPSEGWFEDYSPEYQHCGIHNCVYVDGEAQFRLPLGRVYLEVSKGFEMAPLRAVYRITAATREIEIEIERVLDWRARNWVSADTHVHFVSPGTGLLEGAGEGVNVVNLLASHWGELMTNVGDFDGKTTFGKDQEGGEYLLRVGTENRQRVLGHISLLGYRGPMIQPLCSGGADESAMGDPLEVLLTEWSEQCKKQDGVVVVPHFPHPRMEHAVAIIEGHADAVEMTSWGSQYGGIDPYSLADWYRYLNNGYFVAAVGGTDKMQASTAVGTVRTYARIEHDEEFSYERWKDAICRGETFVTYGPLMEFAVDGVPMGGRIALSESGGTLDITWKVASVTVQMTSVELVANGEVIDGVTVDAGHGKGHFSVKVDSCKWFALLVRGNYAGHPEVVAAHSSPVMVSVAGSEFYQAADAMTILEQVEGSLAYLDTIGTRAETAAYKRMRMVLTSAHRKLHNRMHQSGVYHDHSVVHNHVGH